MPTRLLTLCTSLAMLTLAGLAPAQAPGGQEPAPEVLLQHAHQHFERAEWPQALRAYQVYLDRVPDDGVAQFRLGYAAIQNGEHDRALAAFRTTIGLGTAVEASTYNIACCYALKGETEEALKWLAGAIAIGFNDLELARSDADLASIRSDPRFAGILAGEPYAPPAPPPQPLTEPGVAPEAILAEANERFANEQWGPAVRAFSAYLNRRPDDAQAHFQLGYAAIQAQGYSVAERAFLRSRELGFAVPASTYNLACTAALQGRSEEALDWFERAIDAGFADAGLAGTDPDLESIRDLPRFNELLGRLTGESVEVPEESPLSPMHRQFDFWIGEWDVLNPAGQKVGENSIQRVHGGAALLEKWTSVGGSSGTSLNFYDATRGRWHQTWIDDQGQAFIADGGLMEGRMVLSQTRPNRIDRITWTPLEDGRVRQHWQTSEDGGKTWSTAFDGYYVRMD